IWCQPCLTYHRVHRMSYEICHQDLPDLPLDRLCRNRACYNPEHLDPVTDEVNVYRSDGPAALNKRKTECKHGHPFDEENNYWYMRRGREVRSCRTCKNDWQTQKRA